MKRILAVAVMLLCMTLSGCTMIGDFVSWRTNDVLCSLEKFDRKESYSCGGFQDTTDYRKYYYSSSVELENNNYFVKVATETTTLNAYLNSFQQSVEMHEPTNEIVLNYDFDREIITEDDYCYIDAVDGYNNYNIWIFDVESNVLYYFHDNM